MSRLGRFASRTNVLVAIVLVAGLALGIGLIIISGNDSSDGDAASTTTEDTTPTTVASTPGATLPLADTSAATLSTLTGLEFPADMTEFLTASLNSNTQLDITFVVPSASAAAFLNASGLPAPTADERLILHSSPLWKVNPDPGSTLSSTQGDFGDVHRVVELVGDGSGNIRARIVITPA
ncbi:hypothetical protein BH10ACT3_BH10ACT3_09490 [soil metagenome]